jgi:hypothetical protein
MSNAISIATAFRSCISMPITDSNSRQILVIGAETDNDHSVAEHQSTENMTFIP